MGRRWWDESASSSGGLVLTAALPTTTDIPNNGDVAMVKSGTLKGLMFQNILGTITFITQVEPIHRTTLYSVAEIDEIAVAITTGTGGLTATNAYFYELTQADGSTPAGKVEVQSVSNGSGSPSAIGLQFHVAN